MPFPNKTFAKNNATAIAAGRKGGKIYTEKQRIVSTLAQWKRFGINKKCGEKVMLMFKSKEFTAVDWFKHIDVLEEIAEKDPKFLPTLINLKRDMANFIHKEKDSTQVNVQINMIQDSEKKEIITRMLDESNS